MFIRSNFIDRTYQHALIATEPLAGPVSKSAESSGGRFACSERVQDRSGDEGGVGLVEVRACGAGEPLD